MNLRRFSVRMLILCQQKHDFHLQLRMQHYIAFGGRERLSSCEQFL